VHNDERGRTEILDLGIRRSPTLVNSRYIFIDIAMAQIRDDPRPLPHTARSVSSHKGSTFESNIGLDISNATTNSRSPRSGSHHDVSSSAPQPSPGRPYELAKVVSVDELLAMTPHEYAEPPSLTNSSSLLTVMSEPMSRTSTDDIIYRPFEMFRMDPPIYPLRSAIFPLFAMALNESHRHLTLMKVLMRCQRMTTHLNPRWLSSTTICMNVSSAKILRTYAKS
jgi:hypothetical protein